MVDIESMIKSLRLSWLKRILADNSGVWKNYLEFLLKETGGLVLFNCNYKSALMYNQSTPVRNLSRT